MISLDRLQTMQRGVLSSGHTSISSQNFAQCWRLDSTSNWQEFKEAASGTTLTLAQERHSNTVNEITSITRTVGSFWATPSYDAAGNTTTIPKPDNPAAVYGGTYDAWNRLVKLNIPGTSDTVQEHQYDARNFRTVRKNYSSGTLSETRHFYYTPGWQVLEERLGTTPDSAAPDRHFVWGLRYIDDLVLRERDTDLDGRLDERLYSLQDANWNVVALINPSGAAEERYQYTPFGTPIILTGSMSAVRSSSAFGMEVLFTGQRFEELTKLHLFRMRWFDSLTGRFIGRDPLGYPDGMNAYAGWFVPDGIDPAGLWNWPVIEIGGGKPGRWGSLGFFGYGIKTGSPTDISRTNNVIFTANLIQGEPVVSRLSGTGRVAAGVAGTVTAGALAESVVGLPAAVPLAIACGDQIETGGKEILTGRLCNSHGSQFIVDRYGENESTRLATFLYDAAPGIASGAQAVRSGLIRQPSFAGRPIPVYNAGAWSDIGNNPLGINVVKQNGFVPLTVPLHMEEALKKLSEAEQTAYWKLFSHVRFAEEAKGSIGIFHGKAVPLDRIYWEVERKAILSNPQITKAHIFVCNPSSYKPIFEEILFGPFTR